MLKPAAFANAVTIVAVVFYIIWLIVLALAPNAAYLYNSSMAPGYELSLVESGGRVDFGFAILGGVLMAITIWVFLYLAIRLYNLWTK